MIEFLGSKEYGGWNIETAGLNKDSVVYSFGIGHDVSWDEAMIRKFGCQIHAFDMTPSSIEWVAQQTLSPLFHFHPYGIGHFDGDAKFNLRKKPQWLINEASMSLYPEGEVKLLPVKTLRSIMKELGHDHIDILKLDIEGEEYNVLRDSKGLSIKQILVEMHTPTKSELISKWVAILRLWVRGYRMIAKNLGDYSFVRTTF